MDTQIMEIEKMKFSATELNDYSALSTQNSQMTYTPPAKRVVQMKVDDHHDKDFFEQIYDKTSNKDKYE